MSYNGSGTFLINSAGQPVVANTVISATVFNALTSDLATGLSTAITKDGQTTITNNIPFGSNKITGLGSGTAAADAANLGQVQSTVAKLITVTGTDTITGSMSPQLTAYAAGQLFYFVANAANTGAVTLNIDSLGAKSITRDGSSALAAGDINSGEVVVVIYDGTRFQMINAANSFGNTTINGTLTVTGNAGFQANVSITSALSVGGVFAVTGAATFTANPTLSGGTANGVLYLNGSKVATSGSALYFDGTNLGVGTTTPSGRVQITGASASRYLTLNAPTDGGYITFEAGGTAFADAGSEKGLLGSGSATNFILAARSTNNILFATNNAERMRIDGSSGNVGIGTTPSGYLANKVVISTGTDSNNGITIASATNRNGSIWFADGTTGDQAYRGGVDYQHTTDTLYLYSGGQGNFQLNSSGNLGLGGTPTYRLDVFGTTPAFRLKTAAATTGFIVDQNNSDSLVSIINYENAALRFGTNATERARITAGGAFLVGKTTTTPAGSSGCVLNANGNTVFTITDSISDSLNLYNDTASAYRFYVTNGGTVYATNTTISAISDQRFKENIRDLDAGLDAILALKPRKFDWKAGQGKDIKDDRGFIAQEFEQVFPDLVDEWKDPAPEGEEPYKAVRADLIPILVKAMQEQQAMIEELKAKVAQLEAR